ncbi:Yip1 family protein [Undibacterium sp. Di27W]|uniref:Yip1 family protein n=1 Tax=Undibacterium sp. Di27W TaxID=3413036 RepID=UPI003BF27A7C
MTSPTTPPDIQQENKTLSWKYRFVLPLKTAFEVGISTNPRKEINSRKHDVWLVRYGLLAIITLLQIILFAGLEAPWITPIDQVWTWNLKRFVDPKLDISVLLIISLAVLAATVIAYLISRFAAVKLASNLPNELNFTKILSLYCAIISVAVYCIASLILQGISWLFHVRLSIVGVPVMVYTVFPLGIFIIFWMNRVFELAGISKKKNRLIIRGLLTFYIVIPCTASTIFIGEYLSHSKTAQTEYIQRIRNTPIDAVVQSCDPVDHKIICLVTMWPVTWQDFEFMGEWKLGKIDSKDKFIVSSDWLPKREHEQHFSIISISANTEITLEVSGQQDQVCAKDPGGIQASDLFFLTKGRNKKMQQMTPHEFKIRIQNMKPYFVDIVQDACQRIEHST